MSLDTLVKDNGGFKSVNVNKDDGTIRTVDEAIDAAKKIYAVTLEKRLEKADTIEEKIKAVEKGWPTTREWEMYKDTVDITTAPDHLKRQIGLSGVEIYVRAGAHFGQTRINGRYKYINTEFKVIGDMYYAAAIYGTDFTLTELRNNPLFCSETTIKKVMNITFNDLKENLNHLEINEHNNINKTQIENELDELVENEGYPLTSSKIDKFCSFSATTVKDKFNSRNLTQTLNKLGHDTSGNYDTNTFYETFTDKAKDMLNSLDNYDSNADGYIYLLKLKTENFGILYYVGKVGFGNSIHHRIATHLGESESINQRMLIDNECIHTNDMNFDVILKNIKSIHKSDDESIDEFNNRLTALENRKYKDVINNIDGPGYRVLGGK